MRHGFFDINADFKCLQCRQHISTNPALSGVVNRNHCPYCLYSRHLDLHRAGDRLAACKGAMRPVGLSLKKNNKKYGKDQGELMLIHLCEECGRVSINRIAADDIAEFIYAVFEQSARLDSRVKAQIARAGIQMLRPADETVVRARLFGGTAPWHDPVMVESFEAWANS